MSADLGPLGIAVGHATDEEGATGLTVIRAIDGPMRGGAAVFGRATGTRELHTLGADHLADRVDALLFTGGSAYGLDAAAGVMRWMEEQQRGFAVPGGVVPIVPAAVVFDLAPLGRFDARPSAQMAYDACAGARSSGIAEGSVGAGTGATVGKIAGPRAAMKGGVGVAIEGSIRWHVGAIAVVNALGDVRDERGGIIAGARLLDGAKESSAEHRFIDAARILADGRPGTMAPRLGKTVPNTTLCAVVTDAPLSRVALSQVARAAGAALFRRITPTGTSVDGDVVFALAPAMSGVRMLAEGTMELEALAVVALESAIERAVRQARGRDGIPGLADRV